MWEKLWTPTSREEDVFPGFSHPKPTPMPKFQIKDLPDKIFPSPEILLSSGDTSLGPYKTAVSGRLCSFPPLPVGTDTVASICPYSAFKNLLKCHLLWEILPTF